MNKSVDVYGLVIRTKRVLTALLLMVFGVSLILYGLTVYYIDSTRFDSKISDAEVIERAKKLGMVDLRGYLLNLEDHTVNQ